MAEKIVPNGSRIARLKRKAFIFLLCIIAIGSCQAYSLLNGRPFTSPTVIKFVDDKSGEPIPHLDVFVRWLGATALIGVGSNFEYFSGRFITDQNGIIVLPKVRKPLPIPLIPIYWREHAGIFMNTYSWQYAQHEDELVGIREYRIGSNELSRTIELRRRTGTADLISALYETVGYFGTENSRKELKKILKSRGLNTVSLKSLYFFAEYCREWGDDSCSQLDREILSRKAEKPSDLLENHHRTQAAIRLGIVNHDVLTRLDVLLHKNGLSGTEQAELVALQELTTGNKSNTGFCNKHAYKPDKDSN